MAYSRRTGRSRFTLVLLVLGSLTLLVVGLPGNGPIKPVRSAFGTLFSPFRSAGDAVFKPVADGWHGMWGYDGVKKENQRLRRELEKGRGDQARAEIAERENRQLKRLLKVKVRNTPLVTARVTSGPLSSFDRTITIDAGSGDGIKKGQAVITEGGLVGKISKTSAGSSTITLLTEPSFNVGVNLPRLGEIGLAHGQGQGRDVIIDENIPIKAKVRKGDLVTTSGTDRSFYPPDIEIGKVTKVTRSADGTQLDVSVAPSVNLSSVSWVKVALLEPQG